VHNHLGVGAPSLPWLMGERARAVQEGDCSLREAAIVGSILTKVSIPMLHSAAAVLRLAELPYAGTHSLFLRLLLDKKYALPLRVIDAVTDHFARFLDDTRALPVLWHQALLVFVQRYKDNLTEAQKRTLLALLRQQTHAAMTEEVRRELVQSKCRGDDDAPLPEAERAARAARLAALAIAGPAVHDDNHGDDDNDDDMRA
jgi:essential nuclear protein 1